METVFWLAAAFIAYTYAGYPVLVWVMAQWRPHKDVDTASVRDWPSVCLIVPVFNEQHRVARKIANLRELDYPCERMRILFVSDGSTDETNACIAREPGIGLIAYPERHGKPHALNTAVQQAEADILVFTDVRQEIASDALRYLVARLVLDPEVGAVSAELSHVDAQTHEEAHIGLYWRYEKWIRRAESRLASTVGVSGALYAIWRRDYVFLPEDALLDDFEIPMAILRHGRRVVLERRAMVYDVLQKNTSGERTRKVRTLTGNFQVFARHPWLFSPRANPVFFQFVSHKVFRLAVPYALVLVFVTSVLATGPVYVIAAAVQGICYIAALAGMMIPALREFRLVSFMVVFLELNWAAVLALKNFVTGDIHARWEKT